MGKRSVCVARFGAAGVSSKHPGAFPTIGLLAAALLWLAWLGGCATVIPVPTPRPETSPAPHIPWTPPPGATPAPAPRKPVEIPEDLRRQAESLTLAQVVDVALRSSPLTREAWQQARAAAAELGARRAGYYPELDSEIDARRSKSVALGGRAAFLQSTVGPALALNYLLFDFGGRRADAEAARRQLIAADFAHNAAIQDVVLQVERAYYQYLNAKALLAAELSNLKGFQSNLEAADQRRRAGLATVADVLQSRTALAQIELNVASFRGQIQSLRGALASAMGLPASVPFDVGELPAEVPAAAQAAAVEPLLERALAGRPDLAAARSRALAAADDVQKARSDTLPKLSLLGTYNRLSYLGTAAGPFNSSYSGSLVLSYPLFDGFQRRYRVREAEANSELARARVDDLETQVTLQVWTDYYNLKTAEQRLVTSRALMASATESEDAGLARYKAGVGSILDLLTAQSALANARAQEVQARADWFQSMAQLAHDTGSLGPATASPGGPAAASEAGGASIPEPAAGEPALQPAAGEPALEPSAASPGKGQKR